MFSLFNQRSTLYNPPDQYTAKANIGGHVAGDMDSSDLCEPHLRYQFSARQRPQHPRLIRRKRGPAPNLAHTRNTANIDGEGIPSPAFDPLSCRALLHSEDTFSGVLFVGEYDRRLANTKMAQPIVSNLLTQHAYAHMLINLALEWPVKEWDTFGGLLSIREYDPCHLPYLSQADLSFTFGATITSASSAAT
ncbi:hypothetical protein BDN67DRAFT_1016350 [Paxillus ammoniavirescens]|nr:hypothetical protein BDN67DRAFT_1016350 [Paxillus ammoniavirescens]